MGRAKAEAPGHAATTAQVAIDGIPAVIARAGGSMATVSVASPGSEDVRLPERGSDAMSEIGRGGRKVPNNLAT
jgi:hypothetical protein